MYSIALGVYEHGKYLVARLRWRSSEIMHLRGVFSGLVCICRRIPFWSVGMSEKTLCMKYDLWYHLLSLLFNLTSVISFGVMGFN